MTFDVLSDLVHSDKLVMTCDKGQTSAGPLFSWLCILQLCGDHLWFRSIRDKQGHEIHSYALCGKEDAKGSEID